jgi:D-glycerate 3-kinase
MTDAADVLAAHVREALQAHRRRGGERLVAGLCGAQGSGKSTAARVAAAELEAEGLKIAILSLDDLYLGPDARGRLAKTIHPLLATRGPPGTHDVDLGIAVLDDLRAGRSRPLPRFDKVIDAPAPEAEWPLLDEAMDVILFEGWCVGAVPEAPEALARPINPLEVKCDADGRWRRYVNDILGDPYQDLFARIDTLVLLAAPSFDCVLEWRLQQERELRTSLVRKGRDLGRTMTDEEVARFIQYYERLTRHALAEMPSRAELVVHLDANRKATKLTRAL